MAPLAVSYCIDHDLYIVRVSVWRDAVTQVEDVRSAFEGVDDAFGFLDQVIAPCDHVRRGEVALDTTVGLDVLGDPFGADAVVDAMQSAPVALAKPIYPSPASRGKAITGMPGWRCFSAWVILAAGFRA